MSELEKNLYSNELMKHKNLFIKLINSYTNLIKQYNRKLGK